MNETFKTDMVSEIILAHLTQNGNLSPAGIQSKALEGNITISLPALKKRIDEFKKSQAYKDFSKESTAS